MVQIEEILRREPLPGGVLLRGLPAVNGREDHLVRQVIALANADLAGPRCLMFGIEQGTAGALSVIGLSARDMARVDEHLRICRDAIDPSLDLFVATAELSGKLVAALVVDACGNPPYVTSGNAPAPLRAGECWLFDEQGMRPATRVDLDGMYATRRQRQSEIVLVGIGEDPRCECLEVTVPDASSPPSHVAALKLRSAIAAGKAVSSVMGREDTGMARLAHARIFGADMPYRQYGLDTLVRSLHAVPDEYRDADLHYRFEERAVRLNFSVMNALMQPLTGAAIEIALPDVPGFAVATRLYAAPGSSVSTEQRYPDVRRGEDCFRAWSSLGKLAPGSTTAAFATPLRIAVDRSLAGRKIAIRYSLVAGGLSSPGCGRLRLKLRA